MLWYDLRIIGKGEVKIQSQGGRVKKVKGTLTLGFDLTPNRNFFMNPALP